VHWKLFFWAHTPVLASSHLDSALERQRVLSCGGYYNDWNHHDCLYLLRIVLTAPSMMFLLKRLAGRIELDESVLRESLVTSLDNDLDDDRWSHALLPERWGGLGIRIIIPLAPLA
jgi:hypothetical protein